MDHPSDSTLAAMCGGAPLDSRTYDHVDRCVACRRTLDARGLSMPARPPRRDAVRNRALIGAAAILVFGAAAIAPVRTLALGFVEIFEPHSVAFVPMTSAEFSQMNAMPDFSQLGDARQLSPSSTATANDAGEATRLAGFHVRVPNLPSAGTGATYSISRPGSSQLTFSERKARAWALERSIALRPMPPGMDGTTLRVAFGSIVMAHYGNGAGQPAETATTMGPIRPFPGIQTIRPRFGPIALHRVQAPEQTVRFHEHGMYAMSGRLSDEIFVAQMPVPTIGSTGVSAQTIETYLLSQPGVPPKLLAAVSALRDPSTTLPIPIPIDRAYEQPVFVDGVWGMGIGDDTGLGAFIIWERDGYVYGVGGAGKASTILAIANTLR